MVKALQTLTFDDYASYVDLRSTRGVSEKTLARYWSYFESFQAFVRQHPGRDMEEVVARYNRGLKQGYSSNARIVVSSALNWALRWAYARHADGEPLRFPTPQKKVDHRKPIVTESLWRDIETRLRARGTLKEWLCVRLLRETGLNPSDLVRVSLDEVHLDDSDPRIVRTRAKTGAAIVARVSKSTADLVRRYLDNGRPKSYLFESRPGKHYRRQWPYEVLRRHGVPRDITPRTFRRTLATVWPGDLKTLQHQGGWKDPKTILTHYVQQRDDVHRQTVDVLFGKRDEVADDLAYG